MATECYKCMNSLNPTYRQDMVTTINIEYTLRNPKPVQQPKCKTVTHGINSFRYIGSNKLNSLPTDIQNCVTLKVFKKLINTLNGPKWSCLLCDRMSR